MDWMLVFFVIVLTIVGFALLWFLIFRPIYAMEKSHGPERMVKVEGRIDH